MRRLRAPAPSSCELAVMRVMCGYILSVQGGGGGGGVAPDESLHRGGSGGVQGIEPSARRCRDVTTAMSAARARQAHG
jgi:hypothetical protein